MNTRLVTSLAIGAVSLAAAPLRSAPLVVDSNYTASAYHTHAGVDAIVSYDWDASSNLYYQTATNWAFSGFHRYDNNSTTTLAAANSSLFSGASVVAIGDYVYYNYSDLNNIQFISKYGPLSGGASVTHASTTSNWGLYAHNGDLYITGSGSVANEIFHSAIGPNGSIASSATSLGETGGASGPIAFDADGNLYYAPGFYDLGIYKWTAAEVAAALADPGTNPLFADDHLWLDYTSLYGSVAGATSMLLDAQGNLLLTLTDFSNPSVLVSFGVDEFGNYADGSASTILSDTDRLGELRLHDGNLYLSSGDTIYQLSAVPEPAAFAVIGGALVLGVALVRRRRR